MKLYLQSGNKAIKRIKLNFGTLGTGNSNPYARAKSHSYVENSIPPKSVEKASHPSHIVLSQDRAQPQLILYRDERPPKGLLHEIWAIAADIQSRQAVFVPNKSTSEPMVWDTSRSMFIFRQRD